MVFVKTPTPSSSRVSEVLATIVRRVLRYLITHHFLTPEGEWQALSEHDPLNEASPLYAALLRASSLGYSQIGAWPLRFIRKLGKGYGWQGESVTLASPQCARTNGFALNCARRIKPTARAELEQLISYVTRPPVSEKHLRLTDQGDIELTLKRPFADGTRAVVFSPGEFLGRLAAIISPAWHNLTRFGGILAPAARDRPEVIPSTSVAADQDPHGRRVYCWAAMLKRIFGVDLTRCPRCGAEVRKLAVITEPQAIRQLLEHFGIHGPDPPSKLSAFTNTGQDLTYHPL